MQKKCNEGKKIDLENILQECEKLDILHIHVFLDKKIGELQSSLCEYSYPIDLIDKIKGFMWFVGSLGKRRPDFITDSDFELMKKSFDIINKNSI